MSMSKISKVWHRRSIVIAEIDFAQRCHKTFVNLEIFETQWWACDGFRRRDGLGEVTLHEVCLCMLGWSVNTEDDSAVLGLRHCAVWWNVGLRQEKNAHWKHQTTKVWSFDLEIHHGNVPKNCCKRKRCKTESKPLCWKLCSDCWGEKGDFFLFFFKTHFPVAKHVKRANCN